MKCEAFYTGGFGSMHRCISSGIRSGECCPFAEFDKNGIDAHCKNEDLAEAEESSDE